MRSPTPLELLHGRDEPPRRLRALRAGPVGALLDGADLRYVRVGGIEVVRRIYVAVRDRNWETIPAEYRDFDFDVREDRFSVGFAARHVSGDIDFGWRGKIEGSPNGVIRLSMEGVARADFEYNRIGICVLHPYEESAGRPYRGWTPNGPVRGTLPRLIGPQRFENGRFLALFPAFQGLAIELEDGGETRFEFEGDLFEMEDQRNWTDASFKTYCTPLALGFPHAAEAGREISQRVEVSVTGKPKAAPRTPETVDLRLGRPLGFRLPNIGLGMASHGEPPSGREVDVLRLLRPDHLRVELHLGHPAWRDALGRALETCRALGCGLEAVIFLTESTTDELDRLTVSLEGRGHVERLIVFEESALSTHPGETTPAALMGLVRERLGNAIPTAFAGGSNMYFCELNRTRPRVEVMDEIAYSIQPQEHASDDLSMMETLEAQAETVKSAIAISGGRPLAIGPITLKPRFNPRATKPGTEHAPEGLPKPVDPRQASLFGAAWTLGSVKYLSEAGAHSLTYYETTGWLGVMEREAGSPLPERFPSRPAMTFPMLHVFADLAERKGAELVECRSTDPLSAIGLALRDGSTLTLLLANLTPHRRAVEAGPVYTSHASMRQLDGASVRLATMEPERFRVVASDLPIDDSTVTVELDPYAVVRIDATVCSQRGDA